MLELRRGIFKIFKLLLAGTTTRLPHKFKNEELEELSQAISSITYISQVFIKNSIKAKSKSNINGLNFLIEMTL